MKKIAQKLARTKKNHYLCTAFDKNVWKGTPKVPRKDG